MFTAQKIYSWETYTSICRLYYGERFDVQATTLHRPGATDALTIAKSKYN